jgi:hypothetical protein
MTLSNNKGKQIRHYSRVFPARFSNNSFNNNFTASNIQLDKAYHARLNNLPNTQLNIFFLCVHSKSSGFIDMLMLANFTKNIYLDTPLFLHSQQRHLVFSLRESITLFLRSRLFSFWESNTKRLTLVVTSNPW